VRWLEQDVTHLLPGGPHADVLIRLGGAIRLLEERHAALGAQLERARALERLVQENAFGQSEAQAAPA
jgi:hypothetical protein